MTRFLILFTTVISLNFCFKSITNDQDNFSSTSFVFASGGLNVRSQPSIDSDILFNIPDKTRIIINKEIFDSEMIEEIDGTFGNWRQIKYLNKTGFIFDGFTSSLIPPDEKCNDLKNYLDENFKTIKVDKTISHIGSHYDPNEKIYETRVFYENDLEFFNYNLIEGSMDCIQAKKIPLNDLFKIGKRCFGKKPNKIIFPFSKNIRIHKNKFLNEDILYEMISINYYSKNKITNPWKAIEISVAENFYTPENKYVILWLITEPIKAICLGGTL